MFFLRAPRESLLLRADERNRELETLCSLVAGADANVLSAVNAGGGQSMRPETMPMHGATMSTTPGHAHTMSGAQVSEENEEASSLMCGLLPQLPESSIGGLQLGACVRHGVSSELNQAMPDSRLENEEATFATDQAALSGRMDYAAQVWFPPAPRCHTSCTLLCTAYAQRVISSAHACTGGFTIFCALIRCLSVSCPASVPHTCL